MNYTYDTFKYDAAERQAKAVRAGNRHQENRGKKNHRRR